MFKAMLFGSFVCLFAAQAGADSVRFDSDRWEIKAEENKVINHLGRNALYLKGGHATVKDSTFTDGTIEFDIAITPERSFTGAFWRMQDLDNYEEFYIRPHQSGNPDANQYQPVFYGMAAWQLYHGDGYSAAVKYDFNEWTHVKIVVSGKNAEAYIKDMQTPVLFVNELKRETAAGKVGLYASGFAPAYYSNFSFQSQDRPPLKGKPKAQKPAPAGTVKDWQVSNTIDGKLLETKFELSDPDKQQLTWKTLPAESGGVANLARLQGATKERNTVFARMIIESKTEQTKKVQFGFSDEVRVYFNDRLIYKGSDPYMSRDYRFLGTIGLFDELYLPLKKGKNELWFAVTENFGGWGIIARAEN